MYNRKALFRRRVVTQLWECHLTCFVAFVPSWMLPPVYCYFGFRHSSGAKKWFLFKLETHMHIFSLSSDDSAVLTLTCSLYLKEQITIVHSCSLFFKWANHCLFFIYFPPFQTNNTIFITNKCEKMSCPSCIRHRDSNPQSLKHEMSPITIRPRLLSPNSLFLSFTISSSLSLRGSVSFWLLFLSLSRVLFLLSLYFYLYSKTENKLNSGLTPAAYTKGTTYFSDLKIGVRSSIPCQGKRPKDLGAMVSI